jgi:hypothetical protein
MNLFQSAQIHYQNQLAPVLLGMDLEVMLMNEEIKMYTNYNISYITHLTLSGANKMNKHNIECITKPHNDITNFKNPISLS